MKVAVTADVHLSGAHPERLEALEKLCGRLAALGIRMLIVAGDLFDQDSSGYAEFDALAGRFPALRFLVITGNHDASIKQSLFACANVQVFSRPTLKRIEGLSLLFLPFRQGKTIGEVIASSVGQGQLEPGRWVLVSHGDFGAPRRRESGAEQGYFPLTGEDLLRFRPAVVLLGHVHAPAAGAPVFVPGSPYPVSRDEWGQRRLLLLDTDTLAVEELPLEHPPLRLRLELFLVPDGGEEEQLCAQLERFLAEAERDYRGPAFRDRLKLHLVLRGYSGSRQAAQRWAAELLKREGIASSGIDLDLLKASDNQSLGLLAGRVRERVAALELGYADGDRLRSVVLDKALRLIYGG